MKNQPIAGGLLATALVLSAAAATAAEPVEPEIGPPTGAPPYEAPCRPDDGRSLALTVQKLENGFAPPRPLLIWALGSSYTNFLGDGSQLIGLLRERFPDAPEMVYKKMVGNSVPYQYLRGWARHLVVPDQPDLVLIYTNGKTEDLEKLIVELQRHTTADILVPTLHWREREREVWGQPDAATDQNPAELRDLCRKYGVEFVENRREWAGYLAACGLPIEALLKDAVHQSPYGAAIINRNIARHVHRPDGFLYDPQSRERRLEAGVSEAVQYQPARWTPTPGKKGLTSGSQGGQMSVAFSGNRIELIGRRSPQGGTAEIWIDGRRGDEAPAFSMSYVEPDRNNARLDRSPPRDCSPHGVSPGQNVVPQRWTITVTSDEGDFEVSGSATGPDGRGNAREPFTSKSGQIAIEPDLWRRSERNRKGDRFTFEVYRAAVGELSFRGEGDEQFRARLAAGLANGPHTLRLVVRGDGLVAVEAFEVFEPPLK